MFGSERLLRTVQLKLPAEPGLIDLASSSSARHRRVALVSGAGSPRSAPKLAVVRLDVDEARERFATVPVARLATLSGDRHPHIVPIVFALRGDLVFTAVDAKPKSTTALRRLANVAANPAVAVLADHYVDDWAQLWWVRGDGTARVAGDADAEVAIRLLTDRYPQYATQPPAGPVIAIEIVRWTGWQAADDS